MSSKPTYGIYTLADGRWIVDARYKNSQKNTAIEPGGGKGAGSGDPFAATSPQKTQAPRRQRPTEKRDQRSGRRSKPKKPSQERSVVRSPGARLAFKLLIIGLTSFAFATTSTLLVGQYIVS